MQGLAEFVFASTLWAHDPDLKIRWMDHQTDRYLEGTLLKERFTFRLASATFAWSRSDLQAVPRHSKPRRLRSRLRHKQVRLWDSCLRRHHSCHVSLLPQCVLVFHPIDSPLLMRDLQQIVSETACYASHKPHRSELQASQGQQVARNQRLLSKLITFEPKRDLVPSGGSKASSGPWPCPKLRFQPRLRPMWETLQQPKALHRDEWAPRRYVDVG